MSVSAINWAFEQDIKESGYKLVLLALADYANDDNVSYPSLTTLQKKCSSARSTISRGLKFLIEESYISKVDLSEYAGKKYNKSQNCYKLNIDGSSKTELVAKRYQYQNATISSSKTIPELVAKRSPNHHTTINKPSIKKINKKKDSVLGLNEEQKVIKLKSKDYNWKLDLDSTLHDAFQDYLEMRKENKHKLTSRAIQLLVKKINSFDLSLRLEIIENATVSNWRSFYSNQNNFTANTTKLATNSSKKLMGNALTDHNLRIWDNL